MSSSNNAASPLVYEILQTKDADLKPLAFFVSWHGVLTLAYTGFPPSLLDLKRRTEEALPVLQAENPGSKWPKTSVGCLRERRRLTPEELQILMDLCSAHSSALASQRVRVNCAAVAVYACRSLERVVSRQVVPFGGCDVDTSSAAEEVSEVEQERVQAVLAEARNPGYWFQASQDGNRKKHYTDPCMGATLVHPLQSSFFAPEEVCQPPHSKQALSHPVGWSSAEVETRHVLVRHIRAFRKAVDAALPEMYYWFADESLHVTLRGLM